MSLPNLDTVDTDAPMFDPAAFGIGEAPKKVIHDLRAGQVCLLENLRFHEAEEKNDEAFARELASLCDAYVDDAFGCVHRAHASVHALPLLVRDRAAGFLLAKEIRALGRVVLQSRLWPSPPGPGVRIGARIAGYFCRRSSPEV